MDAGHWVALLSGGKDSSWALYRAREAGLPVTHALAAQPVDDSYLFHVPATELTALIAESAGLAFHSFPVDPPESTDAGAAGDAELEALAAALDDLSSKLDGQLSGITAGAVASSFQQDRLEQLCKRFDLEQFAPLWGVEPEPALRRMVDHGFDIRIVAVAAEGLDRSWLGRRIDEAAVDELVALSERHGIHVLGEGGEYETIVVDGPHMDERVAFEAEERWDGVRGHLEITDAWLGE